MKRTVVVIALAVALAACSGAEAPPAPGNDARDAANVGDVGVVAPPTDTIAAPTPAPTLSPLPSPSPSSSPTAAPTPAAANVFPKAYQGRWGMNANDCDPARDDAKGLIVVTAEGLKFYESRAKLARLSTSSPTRVRADLSFSGEGQTWQSRTVFDLADGGKTLVRSEESPAGSYRYSKCTAA